MTIALSLRINEGVVLASDSATTLVLLTPDRSTTQVANVYNNANKVFNLYRGQPIGAATWGQGFIGLSSISMLMKDLRQEFMSGGIAFDPHNFNVGDIAQKVREYVFEERYIPEFRTWTVKPELGIVVAGISSHKVVGEEYSIIADANGAIEGPVNLHPTPIGGVTWFGQIEPLTRLIVGFSPSLIPLLGSEFGISPEVIQEKLPKIRNALSPNLVVDTMPLQDAINVARYLVNVAVQFSQYAPGASVVGGPIEVAAMSKHEGFKWIARKHYYTEDLNPHHLLPKLTLHGGADEAV